ncbi:TPA: hypothetical protein ACS26H_001023, partial [Serratia marcescens]
QLVEHDLAKVGVASSSLVSRSNFLFVSNSNPTPYSAGIFVPFYTPGKNVVNRVIHSLCT